MVSYTTVVSLGLRTPLSKSNFYLAKVMETFLMISSGKSLIICSHHHRRHPCHCLALLLERLRFNLRTYPLLLCHTRLLLLHFLCHAFLLLSSSSSSNTSLWANKRNICWIWNWGTSETFCTESKQFIVNQCFQIMSLVIYRMSLLTSTIAFCMNWYAVDSHALTTEP